MLVAVVQHLGLVRRHVHAGGAIGRATLARQAQVERIVHGLVAIPLHQRAVRQLLQYALRRELVEGNLPEPAEVLAGYDAVSSEDVLRVSRELLAPEALRLAIIGPFDDPSRFEPLLGG